MTVTVESPAKINLTLDILGKRDDGYHTVEMVMQSVGLFDTVRIWALAPWEVAEVAEDDSLSDESMPPVIRLTIDSPALACDETNLAYRAAKLFFSKYREEISQRWNLSYLPEGRQGVAIDIRKRIPIAAGLAGGSADAAGVLRALNQLYALDRPLTELAEISAQLGSDIPFCLLGGTMLATGRGEILERLMPLTDAFFVLAKPPITVSTAWAYKAYDELAEGKEISPSNTGQIISAIATNDLNGVAAALKNTFELVTIPAYPVIDEYKKIMLEHGAMAALMTGSGPTVFGLADNLEKAEYIASALKSQTNGEIFTVPVVR